MATHADTSGKCSHVHFVVRTLLLLILRCLYFGGQNCYQRIYYLQETSSDAACDVEWILQSAKYMSAGCIYNDCCSISKQHVNVLQESHDACMLNPLQVRVLGASHHSYMSQRHCIGVDIVKVLNKAV